MVASSNHVGMAFASPLTWLPPFRFRGGRVTRLEELPGRIDDLTLQVLQLREEMRTEFSAVRSEMGALATRTEMRELNEATRAEMRQLNEATRIEMHELNEGTLRQMRVLHEDVIARLGVVREGNGKRSAPANRRRRKR